MTPSLFVLFGAQINLTDVYCSRKFKDFLLPILCDLLKKMDEETRKRLEYEEQFFGMSSQFFADSFKDFIKDELESKITMLVDDFKNKIIKEANNPEKFEQGTCEMKKTLTDEYMKALENSFPEVESKISELLNIPPNVVLKEDLPVRIGLNEDINKIKKKFEDLKGRFKALLYLKQEMLEELKEVDLAIFHMESLLDGEKVEKVGMMKTLPANEITDLSNQNYCRSL